MKKRLPPAIWRQLEHTYVGADITENWEALFRRVAVEVDEDLGYAYPHELGRRVTAYVQAMKGLVRDGEGTKEAHLHPSM